MKQLLNQTEIANNQSESLQSGKDTANVKFKTGS